MADAHIRALTARRRIKPTSLRCPSAWQPNPGRRSTYRCGDSVQTTGTTSVTARKDRRADAGKRFFRGGAHQGGIAERKAMIDREHDLPITRQAKVLRISRGSVYYLPRPVSASDLEVMRRLDRLHLEFPFAG